MNYEDEYFPMARFLQVHIIISFVVIRQVLFDFIWLYFDHFTWHCFHSCQKDYWIVSVILALKKKYFTKGTSAFKVLVDFCCFFSLIFNFSQNNFRNFIFMCCWICPAEVKKFLESFQSCSNQKCSTCVDTCYWYYLITKQILMLNCWVWTEKWWKINQKIYLLKIN